MITSDRFARVRLADLSLLELSRVAVASALLAFVLGLFLWMVSSVLIASFLGVVIAVYLRPLYGWLLARFPRRTLAALLVISTLVVPTLGLVGYSYLELREAAEYLAANEAEITARIDAALRQLPFLADADTSRGVRQMVAVASNYGARLPRFVGTWIARTAISAVVFLFTVFYVLTNARGIVAYLRAHVPPRYAGLVQVLQRNAGGVLYGAVYATLVTQTIKSAVVLALNLLFSVPLPVVLALLSFVIGFFPVVGSWSVYMPVAAWLLIFRDAPSAALTVLAIGFGVNTVFLSTYLRPKLAANRSGVLNFYWMFLGLVTGVYTFGLAGILLGPILIGLLKAVVETLTASASWRAPRREGTGLMANEVRASRPDRGE